MCDFGIAEAILAGVAVASTVTSTALGIVGSISQASNAEAQYEYQNAMNRQNAEIASDNAAMERQKGLEDARWQRIKTMQAIGENRTSLASGGFDVNFGSSLDLIEDTSMMGELDALMIESNAEKRARSYDISAGNYLNKISGNTSSSGLTLASNLSKGVGSLARQLHF